MNPSPESTLPANGSRRETERAAMPILVDRDGEEYESVVVPSEDFHSSCSI